MNILDRILDQSQIGLNMFRPLRRNPKISAHTTMEGKFDCKKTPLASTAIKVIVYENTNKRRTWGHHGVQGWYIGLAVKHYRCYKVNIFNTRAEHITDVLELFPENTTMPGISSANSAIYGVTDLISALRNLAPAALCSPLGTEKLNTLGKLAEVFQCQITSKNKLEIT